MKTKKVTLLILLLILFPLSTKAKEGVHLCAVSELKVYLSPSRSAPIVSELQLGKPALIVGVYEHWQKVFIIGGTIGWLNKKSIVTESKFKQQFPYLTLDLEAQEQLVKEYTSFYKNQLLNWGKDILRMRIGYVNKSSVNLRSGPGNTHAVIKRAPFGTVYEVLHEENGWYEVYVAKDTKGWIRADLVGTKVEIDQQLRSIGRQRRVSIKQVATLKKGVGSAMIRTGPSTSYRTIGRVMPFEEVYIVTTFGSWRRIFLKRGGIGWVYGPLLTIDSEKTATRKGELLLKDDFLTMGVYVDRFSKRREQRLDAQRGTIDVEKQIAQKEAQLRRQLAIERKEQESLLAQQKAKLASAEKSFSDRQAALRAELDQHKREWQTEQNQWLSHRKMELETSQQQKKQEIEEQKAALNTRQREIESLAKTLEEKNRKAKAEIAHLRALLQKEIERFEKAKAEALALEKEEDNMEDEEFFFDDEATTVLETKMDEVDSIKKAAEEEIAREKQQLAQQKEEIKKYEEELNKNITAQRDQLNQQSLDLKKKENTLAEETAEALKKIEETRKKREQKFNQEMLEKEKLQQQHIDSIRTRLEIEKSDLLHQQKKIADSLKSQELRLNTILVNEKRRLKDQMDSVVTSERKHFSNLQKELHHDSQRKQKELENRLQAEKEELVNKLNESMRKKTMALEDSLKKILLEKEEQKNREMEKLAQREKIALSKLNQERQSLLTEINREKARLENEKNLFLKRQKEIEVERKQKEQAWIKKEEAKQKLQLDSIQAIIGKELQEKEKNIAKQKSQLEHFAQEIEEKNNQAKLELASMRKALEEEVKKFEAAKKESEALKEKEEALEDEDFFFDNEVTEELDTRMILADSIKKVLEKEMAIEKEKIEHQKVALKEEQNRLQKSFVEQKEKMASEFKAIDTMRQKVELELHQKRARLEEERKKRESVFLQKLKQEEEAKTKELQKEKNLLEQERQKQHNRQKRIMDSLNRLKTEALTEIEEERQALQIQLEQSTKEQASRLESEKNALLNRQQKIEDSLNQVMSESKSALNKERQSLLNQVNKERAKIVSETSTKDSVLLAEREKLKSAWEQLEMERKKFEEEKKALAMQKSKQAPEKGESDISQYEEDLGKFIQAVKGQVKKSSRDYDAINKVLSQTVSNIMKAYARLQKKNADLEGRVTVSFLIKPSGEIANLRIIANSIHNKKLEDIIMREFNSCKFKGVAGSNKPVIMTYPLLFFSRK